MISLTLLPGHKEAKLGPSHPIVGRPSLPSANPERNEPRRSGISLGFGSPSSGKRWSSNGDSASKPLSPSEGQSKLRVRLADDAFLLPFLDRPAEVKQLLFQDEHNQDFMHALQTMFAHSPGDWRRMQELLRETPRQEVGDKEWLVELHSLLFPRSAAMWCRLVDCLGAHGVDWASLVEEVDSMHREMEIQEKQSHPAYVDVFSEGGSSFDHDAMPAVSSSSLEFEALHDVPSTFRSPPAKVPRHSYRHDEGSMAKASPHVSNRYHSLRHRRNSSIISTGEESDVQDFLSGKADGFAGLRLSLPGQAYTAESSSFPAHSRSISAPSGVPMLGARGEQQLSGEARTCSQLHRFAHHRRLSSLFMTKAVEGSGQKSEPKVSSRARSKSLRWAEAPSSLVDSATSRSASTFAATFPSRKRSPLPDPSITMTQPVEEQQNNNEESSSNKETATLGLLPDGRTRHPSAGDNPASKEAAALLAFKNELKLSGCGEEVQLGRQRSDSSRSSALSPALSEDSFATTISLASPETSKRPLLDRERSPAPVSWQQEEGKAEASSPSVMSPPPPPQKQSSSPSASSSSSSSATTSKATKQSRPHLIFPIPPSPQFSRAGHLTKHLQANQSQDAVRQIKQAIGEEHYQLLRRIVGDHERGQVSDESLLEWVAKDCFQLVDQDKESRDLVEEHLLDERYEQRWLAFVELCNVWNVDNAVIRLAKRRCGPAERLF